MNMTYLYYASLAVCGGILGGIGLSSILSGSIALVPVFLSIGGIGMVVGVIYEVFFLSRSTDTAPDNRLIWFTVAMATIGVIGVLWSLVG